MFVVATKNPRNRLRLLRSQTHDNMRVMRQINRVIISFPVSFGDIPLPASVIGFSSTGVLPLSTSAILKRQRTLSLK